MPVSSSVFLILKPLIMQKKKCLHSVAVATYSWRHSVKYLIAGEAFEVLPWKIFFLRAFYLKQFSLFLYLYRNHLRVGGLGFPPYCPIKLTLTWIFSSHTTFMDTFVSGAKLLAGGRCARTRWESTSWLAVEVNCHSTPLDKPSVVHSAAPPSSGSDPTLPSFISPQTLILQLFSAAVNLSIRLIHLTLEHC